ncbi:response regulator [Aureisphaera galaxeae]|uniref:response regulator n=1 Tax=Aureisphaera galaxeae TaxID=1538023 RepID=UPI003AF319E9
MNILLIEDDQIEVLKFKRTIDSLEADHEIAISENGEEALRYLEELSGLPDIILLDLNMPKMSGLEFLSILKQDSRFKYLPTIILTTSINRNDLLSCYEIGIAGYILKPLKYNEYMERIRCLLTYWTNNELIKP